MASESRKRKRDSSSENSDSSCRVVPSFLVNAGHTLTESEESDKEHIAHKKILKKRKTQKSYEESESTDSSVEIIDVKLPNQSQIDAELAKDTQDMDTQAMWDRLCWKEEMKNYENEDKSMYTVQMIY